MTTARGLAALSASNTRGGSPRGLNEILERMHEPRAATRTASGLLPDRPLACISARKDRPGRAAGRRHPRSTRGRDLSPSPLLSATARVPRAPLHSRRQQRRREEGRGSSFRGTRAPSRGRASTRSTAPAVRGASSRGETEARARARGQGELVSRDRGSRREGPSRLSRARALASLPPFTGSAPPAAHTASGSRMGRASPVRA